MPLPEGAGQRAAPWQEEDASAAGRGDEDREGDGDREGEGEEEGSASRVLPWELLSVGKSGGSVE